MANKIPTGSATASLTNGAQNTAYTLYETTLLQGFSDADDDLLNVVSLVANSGEISELDSGKWSFLPDTNFSGAVTFDYFVTDSKSGAVQGTLNLNIAAPVNHSPTGSISIIGNAIQNETLAIQNTLKDENGLGAFSYQWLQNSKAISGATKSTYTLSESDIGTAISVKVSYTDGLKKLESVTSSPTALVEPKPEEILPPIYALSVDKAGVNEGDTVTFQLTTENVAAETEIPFTFGGSISAADVLGGFKSNSFILDSNGNASLAVKFLADKFTDGKTENLTLTLENGKSQSVTVKDSSLTPATIDNSTGTTTSTVKIDGLILTAPSNAAKLLIGSEKNDSIIGKAGADTLRGNAGNDFLDGGLGNDSIDAGNGDDTLIGGKGNDKLIAGSGNDKLNSGEGNDTLDGGLGKDTLDGGVGVDSMTGGDGDDSYFVENSKDVIVESNANPTIGGKDTVTSKSNYALGENIENLILDDAQGKGNSGTGNKSNNVITGSIGDNLLNGLAGDDTLIGGDGVDTLDGGLGMDSLVGGNGDDLYIMQNLVDVIVEEKNGGEQDQIISSLSFDLAQSENVEWLTLSGAKAIEGIGNELDNLLQEEDGGKTNNNFEGNAGNDTINGESGNDTLIGGEGNDELNGGEGEDVAVFSGEYEDYQITLNPDAMGVAQLIVEYSNPNTEILDGRDILNDIEILEFANGDRHNKVDVLLEKGITETDSNPQLILIGQGSF